MMANGKNKVIEKDTGFKELMKRLKVLDGFEVVVGIPAKEGDQVYEDGVPLIKIASAHEFGTDDGRIPRRSFLRDTFDANRAKYVKLQDEAAEQVVKGKEPRAALFRLSQEGRNDVIERINAGIDPPLKDETAARKGSTLQLVRDGILRASITGLVRKEEPDVG
jgi:hypothetical protein